MASKSSFSKVQKRFVDHEWIKIQSDLEINVPSAVTVSGIQVLSTTWKSLDGTVSHGKYIIGNTIVYRDVHRGSSPSSASDGVSSQNFSFTAPPREHRI
jgi:hypothetical protein